MPGALPMLPEVSELVDPPASPLRLSSCPADAMPDARVRERAMPARTVFMTLAPGFRGSEGINLHALDGCMRGRRRAVLAGYARTFHPRQVPALPSTRPSFRTAMCAASFMTLVGAASAAIGATGAVTINTPRVERSDTPTYVDAKTPRFSWLVHSSVNGTRQTAYRI